MLASAAPLAHADAPAHADEPTRLAGLLPLTERLRAGWPFSGAFLSPVGDPHDFRHGEHADSAGFRVLRGVSAATAETREHQGVDLGNGNGGGTVRAASGGLVVRGASDGEEQGYGECVVVAHRLKGGHIAYSVYAHLRRGSVVVEAGQRVWAGRRLGRVGQTGRATAPHLHFEIRMPGDASDRWEHATVEDPLVFLAAHAAPARRDSAWGARYRDWAYLAALADSAADGTTPLSPDQWWPMLAKLSGIERAPTDRAGLADTLIRRGVLPEVARARKGEYSWKELRADARRLIARRPLAAVAPSGRRLSSDARRHLGTRSPRAHPASIGHGQVRPPTLDQAYLLAAALCAADTTAHRP